MLFVAVVTVLPADVEGFEAEAANKRRMIDTAVKRVLGVRYVTVNTAPDGCARDPRCLRQVAATAKADEVVHVRVQKVDPSGAFNASVAVSGADGQPLLSHELRLAGADVDIGLAGLLYRALDVSHYTGTVGVTGLEEGDVVTIDGLPIGSGFDQLSVGRHHVVVRGADESKRARHVDVKYGETVVADMSRLAFASPPLVVPEQPLWPAAIALSASAAGAVVLSAALVIAALDVGAAGKNRRAVDAKNTPTQASDPEGDAWGSGYGPDDSLSTNGSAGLRWGAINANEAATNASVAQALWVPVVVGTGVAVSGALLAFLLWPSEPVDPQAVAANEDKP
jgi:hypothetical protein